MVTRGSRLVMSPTVTPIEAVPDTATLFVAVRVIICAPEESERSKDSPVPS